MKTALTVNNRINRLFEQKQGDILSVYFTAGYPKVDDTRLIVETLANAGVDLIEIGIPFSDPVADGPTIQASSQVALDNGMTMEKLFAQIKNIRTSVDIPLILMGYLNPIVQYGLPAFCDEARAVGIDGLIIPDLPMQEYMDHYKALFDQNGLHNIFLVSPQTSEERIRLIDKNTDGFIYMVSSASVTGAKSDITAAQEDYFKRVNNMGLKNPALIGFGISNKATFQKACAYAKGAIIGSAFIKCLGGEQDLQTSIADFIKTIKD